MKAVVNSNIPLLEIKQNLASNVGKYIEVKEFNRQRKVINKYTGIIIAVYDSVFLLNVNFKQYSLNKSLSYVNFSVGDMEYELV